MTDKYEDLPEVFGPHKQSAETEESQKIDAEVDVESHVRELHGAEATDMEGLEEDDEEILDHSLEPEQVEEMVPVKVYRPLSRIAKIEAIIFASSSPIKAKAIHEFLSEQDLSIRTADVDRDIEKIKSFYADRDSGIHLVEVEGEGFQFQTVPEAGALMEQLFQSKPRPLSRASLETLSIIAYRQPVTRAEVEKVRGVDSGSIIKNLLDRNIIRCSGRKEDAGRPMLFATDQEFLRIFGLNTLKDLPPIHAFQPAQDMLRDAEQALEGAHPTAEELTIPGEDREDLYGEIHDQDEFESEPSDEIPQETGPLEESLEDLILPSEPPSEKLMD